MTIRFSLAATIAPAVLTIASCGQAQSTTGGTKLPDIGPFAVTAYGSFESGFGLAVEPGTGTVFITEKPGTAKFVKTDGAIGEVTGMPKVVLSLQGGLADFVFAPDYATSKTVYISWSDADSDGKWLEFLGRGTLSCGAASCAVEGLTPIWQQNPAIDGGGQFSFRITFAPDGKSMFIASGDRMQPNTAQDTSNDLGSVVHLQLDGKPAADNPLAGEAGKAADIWSWGHRNISGLEWDAEGRLWDTEFGPKGGDELNLVKKGHNYGWPVVSNGDNYDNSPIPDHDTRPEFEKPAISWNPVISPGGFIIYKGDMFPEWKGDALIAGLSAQGMVRVEISGEEGKEAERIPFGKRLRSIREAADGSLWVLEDAKGGRLLHLTPKD
jgi:glucose/arabinose dehydrogenase